MITEKRFTMCHEQNDINGWTMSIIDWETKEPFNYTTYEVHSNSITDTKDEMEDLCLLLNELNDENEQLKQFKEKVFALIDKEIARNEEAIKWEKETIADSGSIEVYNYMLNRLKKELEE